MERRVSRVAPPTTSRPLSTAEREALAVFLGPNERVVVGHPMLDPILDEVREHAGSDDPAALARAIYDWVVDNVEYKKVGTGWGNGDTFWACTERYGNCTDFHALFISLARSVGIPPSIPTNASSTTALTRATASTSAPGAICAWARATRRAR